MFSLTSIFNIFDKAVDWKNFLSFPLRSTSVRDDNMIMALKDGGALAAFPTASFIVGSL